MASLTSKNAFLREVCDCILNNNEAQLKELIRYIHSYWRDLHVRSSCVCLDDLLTIPNVIREALIDGNHTSHPSTWQIMFTATHCLWAYMKRELTVKSRECKPCISIGKTLQSVIPAKQFQPHIPCVEPNQEIQIVFEVTIFDEKWNEVYFLAAIDRFSKFPPHVFMKKLMVLLLN